MGSGRWSTDVYDAAARMRRTTGTSAFAYSDSGARKVHDRLNPFGVTRESRDNAEHPQSLAIAVLFDVTGSMRRVPRTLQEIGDATCDRVPLQIGQFESDNRMDEDLGRIVLEGGGGGQMTESYELALYFMARHTSIDCYEKRGRRGYLFLIGDELPYPRVDAGQVRSIIGDELREPIATTAMMAELRRRYHVYYILPTGSSYAGDTRVLDAWRDLLGQNVIELDDLDAVCETIGLTIGLNEGAIDLARGLADLAEVGSTAGATVGRALARVDSGAVAQRRRGAVSDVALAGPDRADDGGDEGIIRL
jgi:hypothetical protein